MGHLAGLMSFELSLTKQQKMISEVKTGCNSEQDEQNNIHPASIHHLYQLLSIQDHKGPLEPVPAVFG